MLHIFFNKTLRLNVLSFQLQCPDFLNLYSGCSWYNTIAIRSPLQSRDLQLSLVSLMFNIILPARCKNEIKRVKRASINKSTLFKVNVFC